MTEREPSFRMSMNIEGEPYQHEATPHNTELYKHLGELAIYDHAYTTMEAGCTRVWRANESYEVVEEYMLENGYPLHVNLRKVNKADVEAYEDFIAKQIGDLNDIPSSWEEGDWGA